MLHTARSGVNRKECGAVSETTIDIEVCGDDVLSLIHTLPFTTNKEATSGKAWTKCELHVVLYQAHDCLVTYYRTGRAHDCSVTSIEWVQKFEINMPFEGIECLNN